MIDIPQTYIISHQHFFFQRNFSFLILIYFCLFFHNNSFHPKFLFFIKKFVRLQSISNNLKKNFVLQKIVFNVQTYSIRFGIAKYSTLVPIIFFLSVHHVSQLFSNSKCIFLIFPFTIFYFFLSSYRPNISVDYVTELLAFESRDKCKEWLTGFSLPFVGADETQIDCKVASTIAI